MSIDAETKQCTRCGKVKPMSNFPARTTRGVTRPSPRCADCLREVDRERQRGYREANRERARATNQAAKRRASAHRVGVSPERAEELRRGPCSVCGNTPAEGCQLYQSPESGAVLGALCHTCLRGVAMLGGTPERLKAALAFLQSGHDFRDEPDAHEATRAR